MSAFKIALKLFVLMTLLTGLIYPVLVTLIAQLAMSEKANGSLVLTNGEIIGSLLIAQHMEGDHYFWPRPSAIDYRPIPSGGSNLGPTSQQLKKAVEERKQQWGEKAPAEMVYASGSGLDPHMSLEAAYFQIDRVARARSMDPTELKNLINSLAEGRQLGFLGPAYVNVLRLNLTLDEHYDRRG